MHINIKENKSKNNMKRNEIDLNMKMRINYNIKKSDGQYDKIQNGHNVQ